MDSQRFHLTRGGIPGKLFLVSLPIIGTQLMLMGHNLVDMFLHDAGVRPRHDTVSGRMRVQE